MSGGSGFTARLQGSGLGALGFLRVYCSRSGSSPLVAPHRCAYSESEHEDSKAAEIPKKTHKSTVSSPNKTNIEQGSPWTKNSTVKGLYASIINVNPSPSLGRPWYIHLFNLFMYIMQRQTRNAHAHTHTHTHCRDRDRDRDMSTT